MSSLATDEAGLPAVGNVLRPWLAPGAHKDFDVFAPTLCASDYSPEERSQLFASSITSSILVPIVLKG